MPAAPVFADSFYWVALFNARDPWHATVRQFSATLAGRLIVTSDKVLADVLAWFAPGGPVARGYAAQCVRDLYDGADVEVISQDRSGFFDALSLYERRLDKGYSLTDCRSMLLMKQRGLTDVLTHDHHFTQEGFTILFP